MAGSRRRARVPRLLRFHGRISREHRVSREYRVKRDARTVAAHRRAHQGNQRNQPSQHSRRGQYRGQGRQQAGERRGRPGRRGGQPDHREHPEAGDAVRHPPGGRRADDRREDGQHHQDPADQDELVVRAELGDGEVLQPRRREVDLQLADRHHRRPAGAGEPGHELPHAQRGARGQQPRDGAQTRAPSVPPTHSHVLYSVRARRGFGRPGNNRATFQTLPAPATNISYDHVSPGGRHPGAPRSRGQPRTPGDPLGDPPGDVLGAQIRLVARGDAGAFERRSTSRSPRRCSAWSGG